MRYSLRQLAVFDAVATTGSVSQAAALLSLTQSATSMSLSQLEKMLGRTLFDRNGKKLTLTHWGSWLRPKAKTLIHDAQQIELGFLEQHLISGEVTLGASQTGAEHLVPSIISNVDKDFPEIRIGLEVKNTTGIIKGVLNYQYDVGIIEGRCDDSRINQEELCQDHLIIVASVHHPYAKHKEVSFAQLEQAKWVLREHSSGTRNIFEIAIHDKISDLDVWREYEHVPVLRTLVSEGQYLSCLPYLDVVQYIERGELVALNVPKLNMKRTLSFIWRADRSQNPVVDCIKKEGIRMVKSQNVYR